MVRHKDVFLPNTALATRVGPVRLKAQARSIFFFFWGLGPAQPVWARLDLVGPAWSLAQASDSSGQQASVNQFTRALQSVKVINYLCTILQALY
jgi:hypothetical protein